MCIRGDARRDIPDNAAQIADSLRRFTFISRRPILITGCQRSGTAFINLILDSHPRILSIDEDRFSVPLLYSYLYAQLSGSPDLVAFKLPRYAQRLPFFDMLPADKVLWCIRDPLEVVTSMVKLLLNTYMVGADVAIPWAAHPDGGWYEINSTYRALDEERRQPLSVEERELVATICGETAAEWNYTFA